MSRGEQYGDEKRIRLPDARYLGYSQYGDLSGRPVFYFHGFPGSRREALLAAETARKLGIRIIAADRPGFGLSDFQENRTLLHWPDDVLRLADVLGIERFSVVGISGGGPYAAACALRIPHRLSSAGIVCGIGPPDAPEAARRAMPAARLAFFLSCRAPWLMGQFFAFAAWTLRTYPDQALARMVEALPDEDREALGRAGIKETLIASFREAVRNGTQGGAWEMEIYSRPWGFSLQEITMQVHLWHGERDTTVTPSMGRYQAYLLPRCRATFYPGEGHYSLPVNRMEEIVGELTGMTAS
ncbi:MAG: alpha/beta hydrolase [Alphaproteobacteria bacterium]|uniref:Alpha/beta hydrolase n=1 Tax=Candidatus Nitrobium versatile TaxID=2884831 RepID=A0A953JBA8_9BACT|nr:alpha/beta hydrolase [Candidatus Nitrobium versatile]